MTGTHRESARPDWMAEGVWDALAVAGFATMCGGAMSALPTAVRWTVDHDLRWLGWIVFCGGVVFAIVTFLMTMALLLHLAASYTGRSDT